MESLKMPRRKRLSTEAGELIADGINLYWPIGVVVSIIFLCLTLYAFYWAANFNLGDSILATYFENYAFIIYILPAACVLLTVTTIAITIKAFLKQSAH
jgi:hypothetical protein